jgi:hypothetical protein
MPTRKMAVPRGLRRPSISFKLTGVSLSPAKSRGIMSTQPATPAQCRSSAMGVAESLTRITGLLPGQQQPVHSNKILLARCFPLAGYPPPAMPVCPVRRDLSASVATTREREHHAA